MTDVADDDFTTRLVEAYKRGEVEKHPDGSVTVLGHRFDEHGNPLIPMDGCPNCGKGRGYIDVITLAGAHNSGHRAPGEGACSRRCELQLEYAATVEAERITREASSTEESDRA